MIVRSLLLMMLMLMVWTRANNSQAEKVSLYASLYLCVLCVWPYYRNVMTIVFLNCGDDAGAESTNMNLPIYTQINNGLTVGDRRHHRYELDA